jgi:ADP-ribosylglycohydrolase
LFGQVIGDSLGSLVEFRSLASISGEYPNGVRDLRDGGTFNTLAGQPTDDSEMALALARTLVGSAAYDAEAVAAAYGRWFSSGPFDIGNTTRRAIGAAAGSPTGKAAAARAAADPESQSNGSLMRTAPIGIWANSPSHAAETAMTDSGLSHPHPVCQLSCAAFAAAINAAVHGADPTEMLRIAVEVAGSGGGGGTVLAALDQARAGRPVTDFEDRMGWVIIAFHNAFFHLAAGTGAEEALIATVGAGGDTDTNAAITGALLGAFQGRSAFPARWVLPVLTCRPDAALPCDRPRPDEYWPDDLVDLAEALLQRSPA